MEVTYQAIGPTFSNPRTFLPLYKHYPGTIFIQVLLCSIGADSQGQPEKCPGTRCATGAKVDHFPRYYSAQDTFLTLLFYTKIVQIAAIKKVFASTRIPLGEFLHASISSVTGASTLGATTLCPRTHCPPVHGTHY